MNRYKQDKVIGYIASGRVYKTLREANKHSLNPVIVRESDKEQFELFSVNIIESIKSI
jgi:hypothetical protein